MTPSFDPAQLALAGQLSVSSSDGRLRIAGAATSALPVELDFLYVTLRDGEDRIVGIPDSFCKTRTNERHELQLEQFVGRVVLGATRSVELTVPYKLDAAGELAVASLGDPDAHQRVPVTITRRGTLPFVELVSLAAFFNPGEPVEAYRGLDVFVELEAVRGTRTTYTDITARARGADGTILAERAAFPTSTNGSRRVYQIALQFKAGMATELEIIAKVSGAGLGRLGPVLVEGL